MDETRKRRDPMGDKGKKDKDKGVKQQQKKKEKKAKAKFDKQPKKMP
jgi:hypothetical protein